MFILSLGAPIPAALDVVRERESGAIENVYASTATRAGFRPATCSRSWSWS